MTDFLALGLVTIGAVLHALWNYLAKKKGSDGVLFVWAYSAFAAPLFGVLLAWWVIRGGAFDQFWWAGLVSMLLHTGYAVILQKAYAAADMTVIYPISRGLSPVLVTLMALTWAPLPGVAGWLGMALVIVGVAVMSDHGPGGSGKASGGAGWGVLVAAATASYTLWDAYSAQVRHVSVVPYMALSSLSQTLLLTVACWRQRRDMITVLRRNWAAALPVAVLAPLSYGLVLLAMRVGAPSMVATARSLNIVFGTLVAAMLLGEKASRRTWLGTGLILAGAATSAA